MTGLVLFSKMDATPHCNHRSLPFCSTHRHQFLTQKKHPKQNPPSWSPSLPLHELHSHSWNAWQLASTEEEPSAMQTMGFRFRKVVGSKTSWWFFTTTHCEKYAASQFWIKTSQKFGMKIPKNISVATTQESIGWFLSPTRWNQMDLSLNSIDTSVQPASSIRDPDALPKWRSPTSPWKGHE